jgi:hypothetical protein
MLNQLIGAAVVVNQRFGAGGVGSAMQPQRQWLSPRAPQRISVPQRRDIRDLAATLMQPLCFRCPSAGLRPFCALAACISDDHCASHVWLPVVGTQTR